MDDLQFRRNLYADPHNIDADLQQAMNRDAKKAAFAQELNKLEQHIENALRIEVPEGLADRLILRQTMASHKTQKRKAKVHLAIAASIAFAVGATMNFFQFSSAYTQLADHALAHVYHEEGLLNRSVNADLTLTSLNQKMATLGGSFNNLIGGLISADFCRFDSMKSLHLVFQGEKAPITVFVIPKNEDLTITEKFADDRFHGQTIAFKESNIVIISDKNEPLEQWQNKINQNLSWSI